MSTKPARKTSAGSGRSKPKHEPKPKPAETGVDLTAAETSTSATPELPHERDESAGMTGGVQSERVQQGHDDVERGLQDTSRAPEADSAYRKLKK